MNKVLILLLLASFSVSAEPIQIAPEVWSEPRTGMLFARLPGLAQMIRLYNQHPDKTKFIVRYPVGDEANVWAEEVRAWLVSLGVPSRDIRLAVSSENKDSIRLELEEMVGP